MDAHTRPYNFGCMAELTYYVKLKFREIRGMTNRETHDERK